MNEYRKDIRNLRNAIRVPLFSSHCSVCGLSNLSGTSETQHKFTIRHSIFRPFWKSPETPDTIWERYNVNKGSN